MAANLSNSLTHFSVDLYKRLKSGENVTGNIVFSPFSIAAGLCMTLAGARHNTATELEGALHVQSKTVHASFAILLSKLSDWDPDVALHIACRLYSDKTYKIHEEFMSVLRNFYGSTIESVDFKESADEVRVQVNAWVEKVTSSKIKGLLPPGAVDDLTNLILVNAVYFKGNWAFEFDPARTSLQKFYETADRSKMVDMMYQEYLYRMCFCFDRKARAIEIRYRLRSVSMVVVLPDEVDGLEAFEESLTASRLAEIFRDLSYHGNVKLSLPKFKLEQATKLKSVLLAMGIHDMFSESKCDLSGIGGGEKLVVTDAVHKAFIEVNEVGTEAAAASGILVGGGRGFMPLTFVVDRPFLFLIRSNSPDVILFMGCVRRV